MSPLAPGGIFAALLVGVLFTRMEGHWILAIAMLSFCVGNLLMCLAPVHQTYWAMVFPATVLVVFGPGKHFLNCTLHVWLILLSIDLSFASGSLIISNAVEHDLQGSAGGLVNTIVNYSLSIGKLLALTVFNIWRSSRSWNGGDCWEIWKQQRRECPQRLPWSLLLRYMHIVRWIPDSSSLCTDQQYGLILDRNCVAHLSG